MLEIYGNRNGVYFPIFQADENALIEAGFNHSFMLRYAGQIRQLSVASSEGELLTPQLDNPEQEAKTCTGGNPALTNFNEVENVTVFFAIGHSNIESTKDKTCSDKTAEPKYFNFTIETVNGESVAAILKGCRESLHIALNGGGVVPED